MSDTEWNAWQSSWTGAQGPLPDIRAHALRQRTRHRLGNILFFALMAFGVPANLFLQDDRSTRWIVISWAVALSIAVLWIQRGTALRSGNPREALAFLERRVRAERQGAQIARWAYPPLILFVGIYYRDLFGDDAWIAKAVARGVLLAMIAFTASAPWWIRRFTDRQQAEIDRWRRWMDEQQL